MAYARTKLSGEQVKEKHKQAIENCKGKRGLDLLACLVDEFQKAYGYKT